MARSLLLITVVTASVLLPTQWAAADPLIEQAAERYEQGEFEAALELLAEAEQGSGLTRPEVIQLLITRVLAHVGIGDEEAYRRDLLQLATLEPDYQLGPTVPPVVRQNFDVVREQARPIELDARAAPEAAALRIETELSDASGLVSQVRIVSRVGGGPWRRDASASAEVPAPAGATVEWYAEAVGPGGVVLEHVGSDAEPRIATMPGAPAPEEPRDQALQQDEGGSSAWIWIGLGGLVLAAGAVAAYFLFFDDPVSDQTEFAAPMSP